MRQLDLSVWAGLAAFAIIQTDVQLPSLNRLGVLLSAVCVFSILILLGLLISNERLLFMFSIPFIIFIGGYIACISDIHFNIAAWALCLYVLAGWTPVLPQEAFAVTTTFLIAGMICILVCFLLMPDKVEKKINLALELILDKLIFLISHPRFLSKASLQIDYLFIQLYKNLEADQEEKTTLIELAQSLNQISLLIRNICTTQKKLILLPDYSNTHLEACHSLTKQFLEALKMQVKKRDLPNNMSFIAQLNECREDFKILRQRVLDQPKPDFTSYFAYSDQLYKFIKLFDLLAHLSKSEAKIDL